MRYIAAKQLLAECHRLLITCWKKKNIGKRREIYDMCVFYSSVRVQCKLDVTTNSTVYIESKRRKKKLRVNRHYDDARPKAHIS